jgi:hypothetical protein
MYNGAAFLAKSLTLSLVSYYAPFIIAVNNFSLPGVVSIQVSDT